MIKVALYARYSSDNQSVTSIDDQLRVCRDYATREKWRVVDTYQDAAISGASVTLRPGMQALLQDARQGKFDLVLAEALDRISRDQADIATLFKHLRFAGVQIVTLAEGEISELHVGLKGTMNALFLKDLAAKTHRGLQGRVENGKAGGGLCYGYDVVKRTNSDGEPLRGERAINEAEARIVQRIFREFAAGRSPRGIAADLNHEGIPGPLGRAWGDTTIRGHVSRGTGILNNELYVGVLVWNRQRYVKDPSTGRRVSRPNPESEWIRTDVPELRIVDDALWQAVKNRQAELAKQFEPTTIGVREARAKRIHSLRRPAFLLSGLLTCGCCGGKYGIIARDRYGCLNHYRRSTCDNNRTVARQVIERRALAGLQDKLVSADAVARAVRAYVEQTNRQNQERRAQAVVDRQALEKIERAIQGIMRAIEDGMYQPSMKARMEELEREKAEITARLTEAPADMPNVHPSVAKLYRAQVVQLTGALASPETHAEAAADVRSLIGEVVITPGEGRGEFTAVLRGELLGILGLVAEEKSSPAPEALTNAAAGPRNQSKPLKSLWFQGLFYFFRFSTSNKINNLCRVLVAGLAQACLGFPPKRGKLRIKLMILGTVLPEVDDLMALNPEEVAGHILVLVAPHGRLSLSGYYRQHFNPNAAAAYPRDRENDVWRAISEAWNWTESQGLLVPSDVDNFGNGFRVLSRKGEAVADPDRFRLFQEATRFPKQALHPGIRDVCWENLMRGRWDTAVFEAFRDVEVAVREAGGYTAECYGTVLMRRAFGSDGPLTDNDQVEAERDALCHLFAGAIGSYKNPHSHRVGLIDDPSECFEMLILASHLLRIVEARAPATDDDHREQSR